MKIWAAGIFTAAVLAVPTTAFAGGNGGTTTMPCQVPGDTSVGPDQDNDADDQNPCPTSTTVPQTTPSSMPGTIVPESTTTVPVTTTTSAPATTPSTVPGATTAHTGGFWAGAEPYVLAGLGGGALMVGFGLRRRFKTS
jgi:hypothetical protein